MKANQAVYPVTTVGDCYDNALAESFFATLEVELLDREILHTQQMARLALFEYIEAWYNRRRRHQSLGYLSPVSFEHRHAPAGPAGRDDDRFPGSTGGWSPGGLQPTSTP